MRPRTEPNAVSSPDLSFSIPVTTNPSLKEMNTTQADPERTQLYFHPNSSSSSTTSEELSSTETCTTTTLMPDSATNLGCPGKGGSNACSDHPPPAACSQSIPIESPVVPTISPTTLRCCSGTQWAEQLLHALKETRPLSIPISVDPPSLSQFQHVDAFSPSSSPSSSSSCPTAVGQSRRYHSRAKRDPKMSLYTARVMRSNSVTESCIQSMHQHPDSVASPYTGKTLVTGDSLKRFSNSSGTYDSDSPQAPSLSIFRLPHIKNSVSVPGPASRSDDQLNRPSFGRLRGTSDSYLSSSVPDIPLYSSSTTSLPTAHDTKPSPQSLPGTTATTTSSFVTDPHISSSSSSSLPSSRNKVAGPNDPLQLPPSSTDPIEAYRAISRAMRGIKPPRPNFQFDGCGIGYIQQQQQVLSGISATESQILSEAEIEAIRNANAIVDQHFRLSKSATSKSEFRSRRHFQVFKSSKSLDIDRNFARTTNFRPATAAGSSTTASTNDPRFFNLGLRNCVPPGHDSSSDPSSANDSGADSDRHSSNSRRHDSIMTLNFSKDAHSSDSLFDAEANIRGHQVARRARKVEKLLGTDVDRSAIIKSFKRRDNKWYLEPTYDKFDISFDMEGKVDGGTWDALIEYLTPPGSIQVDFEIAFLLTFRVFATPRQFCDALIQRFSLQPPQGIGLQEIKTWQEMMQRPVQHKVYQIISSWYNEYWHSDEDNGCLPRLIEFLSSEVVKNPRLNKTRLKGCQSLIADMEARMRNDSGLPGANADNPSKIFARNPSRSVGELSAPNLHQMPTTVARTSISSIRSESRSYARSSNMLGLSKQSLCHPSPASHNFILPSCGRDSSEGGEIASPTLQEEKAVLPRSPPRPKTSSTHRKIYDTLSNSQFFFGSGSGSGQAADAASVLSLETVASNPETSVTHRRTHTESSVVVPGGHTGTPAEPPRLTIGTEVTHSLIRSLQSITQIVPAQLAMQITVLQSECFSKIQSYELLRGEFGKKENSKAHNVKNMCKWSTQISWWVSYLILRETTAEKRARVLKYFIRVGERCLYLKNYEAVMAIRGGFNSSSVQRLKKTWALLSSKTMRMHDELQNSIKSERNHKEYREIVRNAIPPFLPFLGLYLTDLTFINDGNPNMRRRKLISPVGIDDETWAKQREQENRKAQAIDASSNGKDIDITSKAILINFDKHYKVASIIREIQRFQVSYKDNYIGSSPALSEYILGEWNNIGQMGIDEDSLYELSLQREPRVARVPKISTTDLASSLSQQPFTLTSETSPQDAVSDNCDLATLVESPTIGPVGSLVQRDAMSLLSTMNTRHSTTTDSLSTELPQEQKAQRRPASPPALPSIDGNESDDEDDGFNSSESMGGSDASGDRPRNVTAGRMSRKKCNKATNASSKAATLLGLGSQHQIVLTATEMPSKAAALLGLPQNSQLMLNTTNLREEHSDPPHYPTSGPHSARPELTIYSSQSLFSLSNSSNGEQQQQRPRIRTAHARTMSQSQSQRSSPLYPRAAITSIFSPKKSALLEQRQDLKVLNHPHVAPSPVENSLVETVSDNTSNSSKSSSWYNRFPTPSIISSRSSKRDGSNETRCASSGSSRHDTENSLHYLLDNRASSAALRSSSMKAAMVLGISPEALASACSPISSNVSGDAADDDYARANSPTPPPVPRKDRRYIKPSTAHATYRMPPFPQLEKQREERVGYGKGRRYDRSTQRGTRLYTVEGKLELTKMSRNSKTGHIDNE